MPIVLKTTTCSTTLLQRYRPKKSLLKNPTLRNSGSKKLSQLTTKPPLHLVPISPLSLIAKKRERILEEEVKPEKLFSDHWGQCHQG